MEQQTINNINEILDRIEARMDEMNKMLGEIMDEIDRYKNVPSKTITSTYDGEIMYRYKPSNNEK